MNDWSKWGRAICALGLVIGCNGEASEASSDEPAAGESEVKSAAKSAVAIDAKLGVREDLRAALGQPAKDNFDFGAASVAGVLTVSHQYSVERIDFAGASFRVGQRDRAEATLSFPAGLDMLDPVAHASAKKLFDAMTKAKETTEHNPVLDNDLVVRTSAKGLVSCSHATAAKAPGQRAAEQYWCEVQGVGAVEVTAAKK
jgi:hypothetical protein